MKTAHSVSDQKYITILPIAGREWARLREADHGRLKDKRFIGHAESKQMLTDDLKRKFFSLSRIDHESFALDREGGSLCFLLRKDKLRSIEMQTLRKLAEKEYLFQLISIEDLLEGHFNSAGKKISKTIIRKFKTDRQLFEFVSCSFDSLRQMNGKEESSKRDYPVPLSRGIEPELIREELASLDESHLFLSKLNFRVFVAQEEQIPITLREIGRLREMTFRQVGEGTGKREDIDAFDRYYYQLIIYDRDAGKIVGGYRLGYGPKVYDEFGIEGFYISRLFDIDPAFDRIIRNSVELGRSYIVQEYQRKRLPLFLLWKGILEFILTHPDIQYIYGPVSISKYYSDISKSFIIEFLKRHHYQEELASLVSPKRAFRPKFESINYQEMLEGMEGQIQELDNFIEEIDPHFFKIPVLMRQYMRQNARFIGFNVDPNFSDALDGFMILDLKHLPRSTIEALNRT